MLEQIAQYYEKYDEESRLIKDNSHKLEFITTIHTLDDKIKKGDRILEVGAGTGRYSLWYSGCCLYKQVCFICYSYK